MSANKIVLDMIDSELKRNPKYVYRNGKKHRVIEVIFHDDFDCELILEEVRDDERELNTESA